MNIVWTNSAENDRDTIVNFIAEDNIQEALKFDMLIDELCTTLKNHPKSGRYGRIENTYETAIQAHYILIYQISEETVEILAIVHDLRKFP